MKAVGQRPMTSTLRATPTRAGAEVRELEEGEQPSNSLSINVHDRGKPPGPVICHFNKAYRAGWPTCRWLIFPRSLIDLGTSSAKSPASVSCDFEPNGGRGSTAGRGGQECYSSLPGW